MKGEVVVLRKGQRNFTFFFNFPAKSSEDKYIAYNYGGRKLYVLVVSLKQNKTKDLGERMTCSAKP